jgi:hypothetical protein
LEWDSLYTDLPASSWTMRIAEIDGGDHVVAYAAEHPPYPQVFVRITPAGEIVDVRLHSIGDVPFPVASQALISRGTLLVSISNTINGNPVMLLNSELDILWTYSPRMHGIPVDDISAAAFTADGNLVLATSYHPAAGHLILLGTALSAEPPSTHMPYELHLAAYPNPFNARTTLLLTMPTAGDTRVCLVDMLGRIALDQSLGTLSPGEHPVEINAANLPTGIYVVNVQSGSFTATQKLLLLK